MNLLSILLVVEQAVRILLSPICSIQNTFSKQTYAFPGRFSVDYVLKWTSNKINDKFGSLWSIKLAKCVHEELLYNEAL